MGRPETKYVAVGNADVAYQVFGERSSDLLFFIGLASHIEMAWENPDIADFLNQLATLRRVIVLDREITTVLQAVHRRTDHTVSPNSAPAVSSSSADSLHCTSQ